MLTIDLLKGKGIPAKSRPKYVVLAALPFVLIAGVAIFMVSSYISDKVVLQALNEKLASYNSCEELSGIRQFVQNIETDRKNINTCLAEVNKCIGTHMQWSPVLMTVVESLPESVTLRELEVKRQTMREKAKDPEGKPIDVTWYRYTLQIGAKSEKGFDGGEDIQQFVKNLRTSDMLSPKIEEIQIVSNQATDRQGDDFVEYQIDCVFKRNI